MQLICTGAQLKSGGGGGGGDGVVLLIGSGLFFLFLLSLKSSVTHKDTRWEAERERERKTSLDFL